MEQQAGRGWYDVGDGWAGLWDGDRWTGERISHEQLAALTRPPAPPPPMQPPPPAGQQRQPLTARQKQISGAAIGFAVLMVLFGVIGGAFAGDSAGERSTRTTLDPFTDAAEKYRNVQRAQVESCCAALVVVLAGPADDRPGQLEPAMSVEAFGRLLARLGMPPGTAARMAGTRALDGTQSAEGEHARATWTFHPDQGLRVVFEPT